MDDEQIPHTFFSVNESQKTEIRDNCRNTERQRSNEMTDIPRKRKRNEEE